MQKKLLLEKKEKPPRYPMALQLSPGSTPPVDSYRNGDNWELDLKRNDPILNNRNDFVLQNWRANND